MKPLFCIDITNDKKNSVINGDEFITQKTDDYLLEEAINSANNVDAAVNKARLPLPIRILHIISAIGCIIFVRVFLKVAFDGFDSIQKAFNNAPYVFIGGICCVVIYLIILFLGIKKKKKILSSEDVNNASNDFDKRSEAIFSRLNVPTNALKMDVMEFTYKIKNESVQFKDTGTSPTPIRMLEVRAFVENDYLVLATLESKWSIPLSALEEIETIEKKIGFMGWNKDVPFNKGEYKKYKLAMNNYDIIFMKPYHILHITHNAEEFAIYIPCYELENLQNLINRK